MVAAVTVGLGGALVVPDDPALGEVSPHPLWLAVLLLAARHGTPGMALALAAQLVAVVSLSLGSGTGLGPLRQRLESAPDLGALIAALVVGATAARQLRRQAELAARSVDLAQRLGEAEGANDELCATVLALRARYDRIEHSCGLLCEVAARLEADDPVVAATAALELIQARTGARAGVVWSCGDGPPRVLSWRGGGSSAATAPGALDQDATAAAARDQRRLIHRRELGAARTGSDVAAPLLHEEHRLVGVIALRELPYDGRGSMALLEVAQVARWLARSLARRRAPTPVTPAGHAVR